MQKFIARYLCRDLMTMQPKDGWTDDEENTWALAGNGNEPVVIYSLSGSSVHLRRKIAARSARWFNPRSGEECEARSSDGLSYAKPDAGEWILLVEQR